MAGQKLQEVSQAVKNDRRSVSPEVEVDYYLFVLAGALVVVEELDVLGLQPTSAKQATSANNESNFIVMCI